MKKIFAALMVTAFAFCVGTAFAATEKCKVTAAEVKDEKAVVTMECDKDAQFKVDDRVKVRTQKKQAVEGC
ncbi:MAG: hypothetical protein D3916_04190 [Candidatus Electrothrix sp. MAN1_4]|nr:hypothetical protein [Candidatus Electrothrix sp. MAN1_4]